MKDLLLEFIKVLPGILWPLITLTIFLLLKDDIKTLIKKIKKGSILGNGFELSDQLNELYVNVENIKNEVPITSTANKTEEKTIQDEILKESEKDPKLGLIRLAKELEKECKELMFQTGWHNSYRNINIKQSFSFLTENGIIPKNTSNSVNLFLEIRNKIIHSSEDIKSDEILRAIDLGLTLLNTIQSIPREVNIVFKTNVDLYYDENLTQKVEKGKGILLESLSPGKSIKTYKIFPSTKTHFKEGEKVTWEWSFENQWDKCYYKDPISNKTLEAWHSSAEFIGRHIEKI